MPENKFKAGDRLVAKHNISSIRAGDVVVVKERASATENYAWVHIVGHRDYTSDGSFRENDFELWQPKVGERVRIAKAGMRWKEGHVGVEFVVTHQQGTLDGEPAWAGRPGRWPYVWKTSELEPLPVAAEAQPAALKIEAGRFYKTRDGRKVGPMQKRGGLWPWTYDGKTWDDEGNWTFAGANEADDLIAEWVELSNTHTHKPIVAATVDYQADEYGSGVRPANDNTPVAEQPVPAKFKVGDRVRTLRDWGAFTKAGDLGTIHEILDHGLTAKIDGGDGFDWFYEFYEVELLAHPTAIVARIDNGQPRPNPTPFVHHSQEAAAKEAARLANVHRGKQFGVYVLTGEPAFVEPRVRVGDVVTLTAPVRVTGFTGGKANIVTADGGSFVLPVSALAAA